MQGCFFPFWAIKALLSDVRDKFAQKVVESNMIGDHINHQPKFDWQALKQLTSLKRCPVLVEDVRLKCPIFHHFSPIAGVTGLRRSRLL